MARASLTQGPARAAGTPDASGGASPLATAGEPLALGPMLVAPSPEASALVLGASRALADDLVAVCFHGGGDPRRGERIRILDGSRATDIRLVGGEGPDGPGAPDRGFAVLAPRRFLAEALPIGDCPAELPRSVGLDLLHRYVSGLLALSPDGLSQRQGDLAARAVRSLLASVLLWTGEEQGLAVRRRTSLIERAGAYVDANLGAPLSVQHLCAALGCSRSALYRAAEQAGGVAELILARRLHAVHERLSDGNDRRLISEIARDCGFGDVAQFNRRFKARFGVPPSQSRRGADGAAPRRLSGRADVARARWSTPCR